MKPPQTPSPLPDPPPPLHTLPGLKQIPVDDAKVPEGYELIKVKSGKVVMPVDRTGTLRKSGETWWESTWLDGKVVPIYGYWDGRRGAKYVKPAGFDEREMCGAYMRRLDKWCEMPAGKCPMHCGRWAMVPGRSCANPKENGKDVCCKHGSRKKLGLEHVNNSPDTKPHEMITRQFMRKVRQGIADEIIARNLGTSVSEELLYMRTMFVDAVRRAEKKGSTEDAVVAIKDAWNDVINAKSEADKNTNTIRLAGLIQNGVGIAASHREAQRIARETANLAKVQITKDIGEKNSMDYNQAITFIAGVMSILATHLSKDLATLAAIRQEIAVTFDVTPDHIKGIEHKP